ncbi:kinesin-like protein KIFC3 isoform X1 [Mytilus edulis]|uniref:kinesin-like protein KIFC3 isoform X1 n=1 Tax=Mytilus edulis TaxID=6550 RepID=UPI0039EFF5AD
MNKTPKIKRAEPVFKTPMTYSPRIVGNKPVPSPSRAEIWKQQLGFDVDPEEGETTDSESEDETRNKENENFSVVEYHALQKELDERNTQRDELLFKIKTLTDKNKHYKSRLEKEELTKRQQMKILCKSQETQLQEKDNLIDNLQSIIEEHEEQLVDMEHKINGNMNTIPPGSYKQPPSVKLIEDIKRLQIEKTSLTTKLETITSEMENHSCSSKGDNSSDISDLQQVIERLEDKNRKLEQELQLYKSHENDNTGPCHTDTEKQVDKLQTDNDKLHEEIEDLKRTNSRTSDLFKLSTQEQQQLQDDLVKLSSEIKIFDEKITKKNSELHKLQARHREEVSDLKNQNQELSQKVRNLQAEIMSLQAKSPEVVTKIKKVEIQIESEQLKSSYISCQQDKDVLQSKLTSVQLEIEECKQKLTLSHSNNTQLLEQVQHWQNQYSSLESESEVALQAAAEDKERTVADVREAMKSSMHNLQKQYNVMCQKIGVLGSLYSDLTESYILIEKQAKQFPKIIKKTVTDVTKQTTKAISEINEYNKELVKKYHREMFLRKKYHNELVELKGNIRVFCRVRPKIREDGSGAMANDVIDYDRDDDGLLYVANKARTQTFEVDKVFTQTSTQPEVFDEVKALVTSCIDGYNVCIFAYGQTGSGKTFTMEGPQSDPGINQRALKELFSETSTRGGDWQFTITVSAIEIYNEMIRDLLSDDPSYKMEVKMNPDGGGLYVPGLSFVEVSTVAHVNEVFSIGQKNRATATTNMNEHSSRSHALLCVTVTGVNRTTNTKTIGKLNLVDLAGSERVSKSGADGTRLKEAQNINKSLSSLGDVIHALRSKQNFVPYRNSKLTYLLQDSLGGDSKTLMIVQVAPVEKNVAETICSLNFAQRVRTVELGQASKKMESGDVEMDMGSSTPSKSSTPLKQNIGGSSYTPIKNSSSTPTLRNYTGTPIGSTTPNQSTPNKGGTPVASKYPRRK